MDLTKYELARIIGARSLQLAQGAPPLVEVNSSMSFIQVAEFELKENVVPLVVIHGKREEE